MGRRTGYGRTSRQRKGGRMPRDTSNDTMGSALGLLLVGLFFDTTRWICLSIFGITLLFVCIKGLIWIWPRLSGEHARRIRSRGETQLESRIRCKASTEAKIQRLVSEHLETLTVKRTRLIMIDEYGVQDTSKWSREVSSFFNRVIAPQLTDYEHAELIANEENLSETFVRLIEAPIIANTASYLQSEARSGFTPDISPRNFEHWCVSELKCLGWNARATPASGDQGADVIAERNGQRAIIQCKLYTAPVGNKAVQEVYAAKSHDNGTIAAVVSTSGYTSSAKALAASTGVLLLDRAGFAKSL